MISSFRLGSSVTAFALPSFARFTRIKTSRAGFFAAVALASGLAVCSTASAGPMTVADLLTILAPVKPPVDIPETIEGAGPEAGVPVRLRQTTSPPDPNLPQFCLDSPQGVAGGSLVILERPFQGVATAGTSDSQTNVTPAMVSDILAFPPLQPCFLTLFSDPLADSFPMVDPYSGNTVNNPFTNKPYTFNELLSTDHNRLVTFITEGFLMDPRCAGSRACRDAGVSAPFGNAPVDLVTRFGITDATIFITPRPNDCEPANLLCGQVYLVRSDTPEPGTLPLVFIGTVMLTVLASRISRIQDTAKEQNK